MIHRFFFKSCALTLLTMALAACGSGGDDVAGGGGSTPGVQDTFFSQVKALIATSPDTAEPREIDSIVLTSPENTESENIDS